MAGVNKVIIVGHLGRDPEVKSFANGGKVVNLSVATSESWKDKQTGERKERTEWHRVSILNDALAGVAEKYLRKGSKVYLEGQLETRKWQDQSGADRYSTEVVLRPYRGELVLLDGRGDGQNDTRDDDRQEPYQGGSGVPGDSRKGDYGGGRSSTTGTFDDEIPF